MYKFKAVFKYADYKSLEPYGIFKDGYCSFCINDILKLFPEGELFYFTNDEVIHEDEEGTFFNVFSFESDEKFILIDNSYLDLFVTNIKLN